MMSNPRIKEMNHLDFKFQINTMEMIVLLLKIIENISFVAIFLRRFENKKHVIPRFLRAHMGKGLYNQGKIQ